MIPHPIASLKAALRAHWLARPDLAAAFGDRIVETLPPGLGLPFLLMGEALCRDEPDGSEVELALWLVRAEEGTAGLLALLAGLELALAESPPASPHHRIVSVRIAEARIDHDPHEGRSEARLRLRAFLETPEE
ncbi:MAG: DUF3168 domain-containing protein [Beijerinckiaceae bacterium]|nr:DUF3168 domain-containing protein [Beijerinckiaceae bacterium]MCZ8298653.1 DUF3168 domain-containing protein [Beijerinckiaceae bacterium]